MKLQLHRLSLLGAVVAVFAASGCGGGNGAGSSESEAASTSSSSASSAPVKTITIKETEYKLTPSSVTLSKPGTYEFKVVNDGTITHALEVEGKGVEQESGDVSAGESKTFDVDLKSAGSYEMYCPVDGHRSQGMEGKITIGSSAAGGGGTTMQTSTTQTSTGRYGY